MIYLRQYLIRSARQNAKGLLPTTPEEPKILTWISGVSGTKVIDNVNFPLV